jgi:phosphatidylserine/phosphatidylglycerophosphate/cardiolipin synthase-like enzyme
MHLKKLVLIFVVISSCSTPSAKAPSRNTASENISTIPLIKTLPKLSEDKGDLLLSGLKKAMKNRTKGKSDQEITIASIKLRDYLLFLGLTEKDFKKAEATANLSETESSPKITQTKNTEDDESDDGDTGGEEEDSTPSNLKAIMRLFISSTQFLDCPSMVDWECLEKIPSMKPTSDFRNEKFDLSTAVYAGKKLDMDVFFTEAWDGSKRSGLSERFAEKINNDADKSLLLAMYGIDDIQGSMEGVYQSIMTKAKSNQTDVRAVVDVMGVERSEGPWFFNYLHKIGSDKNIFSASKNDNKPEGMHLTFQYDGTPTFIREMNEGIKSQEEAKAHIEWPFGRIMHNKFAVLENSEGLKSVWTGTANISKNCMGIEANANMAIYIRNTKIAEAYQEQFNLMFNFDKNVGVKSKTIKPSSETDPILVGRFHRAKFPVNKRLFTFEDGTNVRVHFAPTDDAEHRVIIPMLLSANAGDEIRISMFGGTGYEIVRAMQYAVAKGANIRIAFDRRLGHGMSSWIRDAKLNVNMPNPYIGNLNIGNINPGKISYRVSTWTGKNHYKAGSLTRRLANGSMHAEQIIVGSQNWSSGGNDYNDENLVSIQNLKTDVVAAAKFNEEFDTRLWLKSKEERPK